MKKEEREISIGFLFHALLRRIWIIVLATVVCAVGFFMYYKLFVKPMYSATTKLYVNNLADSYTGGDYISSTEIDAAKNLVNTFITILETPDTADIILEKTGLHYSTSQILAMISAGSVNDTEVFYVAVSAPTPEEAQLIANTVADVLPTRISSIIDGSSVRVVQKAQLPTAPSSPNVVKQAILGALLGIFASCAVIIVLELIDNTIHDSNYPSETYGINTLAVIPDLSRGYEGDDYAYSNKNASNSSSKTKAKKKRKHTPYSQDNTVAICDKLPFRSAETYKMLRTTLLNISENGGSCSVVGISSPNPGDGKSTLAVNMAYTFAQTGKTVLLIEADLRKPVLAKRLKLSPAVGLSDMLLGEREGVIQDSGYLDNWKVCCAGKSNSNPSEILSSDNMENLVAELRTKFDYIIIDLPPVNLVTDAIAVSGCLDGMIVAVRQNSTTRIELDTAMNHLSFLKTEILGFVVTNSTVEEKSGKYYKYKKYGRYSGYYKY